MGLKAMVTPRRYDERDRRHVAPSYSQDHRSVYLLTVLAGLIAEVFISDRLVVSGDAEATAANILSHEPLFRLGFMVYLIEMAAQITMTVLLYGLLKPVSRRIALLSMTLGLVGCTIKTLSRLFYYAPLLALGGASYLRALAKSGQDLRHRGQTCRRSTSTCGPI